MIELSPDAACMLYLGGAIAGMLCILLTHKKRRASRELVGNSTKRFTCEFCHTSYLDETTKSLTRCPQCHFLNKNLGI